MQTIQIKDKEFSASGARAQMLLWSDACCRGLLVREKASQENHLTDADHKQDDGFSNRPEGNAGVEVFSTTASLGFPETEVCLVVNDRLQSLVNGNTSRFHLEKQRYSGPPATKLNPTNQQLMALIEIFYLTLIIRILDGDVTHYLWKCNTD